MTKATPLNTRKTRAAAKPTSSPPTSKPSSPSYEIGLTMDFWLTSYDTVTLKEFVRLYKSLLTTTGEFVVVTALKQRLGESSVIPRPRVQVQTSKRFQRISGLITSVITATIFFNAISKEPTDGPSQPMPPD